MKALTGVCAVFLSLSLPGLLPAQKLIVPEALSSSPEMGARPVIADVQDRHEQRVKAIWFASILAMVAGTTLDAASSWHKRESNGLLASSDGTFGAKGVGIKAGIAVGVLLPQIAFRKRKDLRSAFAIGNFAEAGIFTGAAIHNFGVAAPKQ